MKHLLPIIALLVHTTAASQSLRQDNDAPYSTAPRPAYDAPVLRGGGPPPNDDCANAQVIALTTNCYNPIEGDNSNATSAGPDPSCDDPGATTLDVWYTFTTGSTGATAISLSPSTGMTDWEYVIYEGACDGNEVACRILPAIGQQEMLAASTTHWLRVYTNPAYGSPGAFTLCIQDLALITPPANDDCMNVIPTPLTMGSSVTFTGDATYALNTEGLPYNSLWNAFTITEAADVHVSLCGTSSSMGLIWLGLYLTCPANIDDRIFPGSHINCPNGLVDLCYGNLPAGTYYYPVSNALTPGAYSVEVSAEPAGTISPVNDDCEGAIALSAGTWCDPATFFPSCASPSPLPGGCLDGLANPEDDVWYSFTATQTGMSLGILPHSLQFGPIVEVFSGSCGSLTSVACTNGFTGDTLEINMNTLVPGNVYSIQVYNGYGSTPTDDAGYDLCLIEGLGINIGVAEEEGQSFLGIHPNPSTGDFTVRTTSHGGSVSISVMDATGRAVVTEQRSLNNGAACIEASGRLAPGTYLLRMLEGSTVRTGHLIIH